MQIEKRNKQPNKKRNKIGTTLVMAALFTVGMSAPVSAHGAKAHGEMTPKALNALYSTYLEIQHALAGDNLEAAQKESQAFLKQPVKFPTDLSHSVKAKDILGDFNALNGSADIAAFRKAFSPFSDRMALLVSEVKYQGDKPVLAFHCPMANGNKGGNWLQAEKGVANPYFGSDMLTCGSLTQRLHEGNADGKQGKSDPKAETKTEAKTSHQDDSHGNGHGTDH